MINNNEKEKLKRKLFNLAFVNTYTNTMSPLFEYAGIALAIVANPYEYIIASSVLMNFASRSSNSKCTSI